MVPVKRYGDAVLKPQEVNEYLEHVKQRKELIIR